MPLRRFLPVRLTLSLLLVIRAQLHAQDTTKANPWPERGWVFLGLGRGSINSSFAYAIGGSYSKGPLLFTLRRSGAAQFYGDGIAETAFLIGVRSGGTRNFVSAQLGPSAVHRYHTATAPATTGRRPPTEVSRSMSRRKGTG